MCRDDEVYLEVDYTVGKGNEGTTSRLRHNQLTYPKLINSLMDQKLAR